MPGIFNTFIFIRHNLVEKKDNRKKEQTRKHKRTHTWTNVSDAEAVVDKGKQQNYNDYTESNNVIYPVNYGRWNHITFVSFKAKSRRAVLFWQDQDQDQHQGTKNSLESGLRQNTVSRRNITGIRFGSIRIFLISVASIDCKVRGSSRVPKAGVSLHPGSLDYPPKVFRHFVHYNHRNRPGINKIEKTNWFLINLDIFYLLFISCIFVSLYLSTAWWIKLIKTVYLNDRDFFSSQFV